MCFYFINDGQEMVKCVNKKNNRFAVNDDFFISLWGFKIYNDTGVGDWAWLDGRHWEGMR